MRQSHVFDRFELDEHQLKSNGQTVKRQTAGALELC
jgi:hypothetical protein